jgi:H+/Na+-translocating ferredoxin:NAD+ oxidoreductase subunit B
VSDAVLILTLLALVGAALGYAVLGFKTDTIPLSDKIDALLPQTQCRRCSYAGCRPYAEAIAAGTADINQCPPGGAATIRALAGLLGRASKPLNPEYGEIKAKCVAVIDESTCIGCTLCLQACPVDAIVGANKYMHTVISSECTGCELCIAPCPVDCIAMVSPPQDDHAWERRSAAGWPSHLPLARYYRVAKARTRARERQRETAVQARARFEFRNFRLEREKAERTARLRQKKAQLNKSGSNDDDAAVEPPAAARRV